MLIDQFSAYLRAHKSKTAQTKYPQAANAFLYYLEHEKHQTLMTMEGGALFDFVTWAITPEPGVKTKPPSAATVHLMIAGVKSYLDFLRRKNINIPIQARPERPRLPQHMPIAMSQGQLDVYVQCCLTEPDPLATALLIMPYCGLRIFELCQLRLSDVMWEELEDGSRCCVFHVRKGKGGKERFAPMFTGRAGLASRTLKLYLDQERPKYKLDLEFPREDRWLFPMPVSHTLTPINPRMLQKRVIRFRRKVGISGLHPHAFRSHWCTALLSVGHLYDPPIDALEVARYMGHVKGTDTMQEHYASVRLKDAQTWMGVVTRPTLEMYSTSLQRGAVPAELT